MKNLVGKLSQLEEFADVIIIDTGAGISPAVMEFILASPETVLVTTPEPTSITDSYALLKALSMTDSYDSSVNKVKMLANRVSNEKEGRNLYEKLNSVVTKFLNIKMEYLGHVVYDDNMTKAVMSQKPVTIMYPHSPASRCYENIVSTLETGHAVSQNAGVRSFFRNVFSRKMKNGD